MKTCPVCKSRLFDDMDTCYGCMYRFGDKSEGEREGLAVLPVSPSPKETLPEQLPSKELMLESEETHHCKEFSGGTWSARFGLANQSEPNAVPFTCALTIEIAPAAKGSEAGVAGA